MDQLITLSDIPFHLDTGKLMEAIHISEDDEYYPRVEELLDAAQSVGRPKALYKVSYIRSQEPDSVTLDAQRFQSRILSAQFEGLHKVFPYAATCGTELENLSDSLDDFLERFWMDTIKEMALDAAVNHLKSHLKLKFNIKRISSISPGSLEDWPIVEQQKLFDVLGDTYGLIGLRLTPSFLMTPIKSVSGILFPSDKGYEDCHFCDKKNCPKRRA